MDNRTFEVCTFAFLVSHVFWHAT